MPLWDLRGLGRSGAGRVAGSVFAAILAAAGLTAIQADYASAHLRTGAAVEISQAYGQFLALKAKDQAQGHLPRLSDPDARAVLDKLWNDGLFGQSPYDAADIKALLTISSIENNVFQAYVGARPDGSGDDADYENEKTRGASITIVVLADLLEGASATNRSSLASGTVSPKVRDWLEAMTTGLTQIYVGGAEDIASTLRPEHSDVTVRTMAKYAGMIAPHLPLSARQQIIAAVTKGIPKADPGTKAELIGIMTAMAGQECDAVCNSIGHIGSQTLPAATEATPLQSPAPMKAAPQPPARQATVQQRPAKPQAPQELASAQPKPASAPLQQFYSLLGKWRGRGEYHVHDEKPIKLSMRMSCSKAPDGSAVACELSFKGGGASGRATELFVAGPSNGRVERFVVDDATLTRSEVEWTDSNTMLTRSSWQQSGEKMESQNTTIVSGKMLDYRNVTMADGKTTGILTAHLTR